MSVERNIHTNKLSYTAMGGSKRLLRKNYTEFRRQMVLQSFDNCPDEGFA